MATLNIKGLPDDLYELLKEKAKEEHRSISQQVTYMLRKALERPKTVSLTDFRGVGKELWKDVDASVYVAEERDSWD